MWSVLILCPATLHNDVCTAAYETESKPCRGHTRQSVSRATCRSSRSKWAVKLWCCIQLVALVWTCPISAHHLADDPRCHIGVAHPLVLVGLTCVHKFYVTIQIRCKGRAVGQEHQILGRVYWAGEARTSPSCRTRVHHRTIHTHMLWTLNKLLIIVRIWNIVHITCGVTFPPCTIPIGFLRWIFSKYIPEFTLHAPAPPADISDDMMESMRRCKQNKEWFLSQHLFGYPSVRPRLYSVLSDDNSCSLEQDGMQSLTKLYRKVTMNVSDLFVATKDSSLAWDPRFDDVWFELVQLSTNCKLETAAGWDWSWAEKDGNKYLSVPKVHFQQTSYRPRMLFVCLFIYSLVGICRMLWSMVSWVSYF